MIYITPQLARLLMMTGGFLALAKASTIMLRKFKSMQGKKHRQHVQNFLRKLYKNVNAFSISLNYRDNEKIKGDEFTYGEILFSTFRDLLAITNPQPGEIFYDLGCGSGKAVFTTAMNYPEVSCHGIELLPPLYKLCLAVKEKFNQTIATDPYFKNQHYNIDFHQADHLQYDFSDGNIIFLNATCFQDDDWDAMIKLLEKLPKGARVISSSKAIQSKKFIQQHRGSHLMSWGLNTVYIYQRK